VRYATGGGSTLAGCGAAGRSRAANRGGTADEFESTIKSEIAKWTKVIRDAAIKAQD
jgi:hypothetical protein